MNSARIIVLITAVSAGGVAAYPASGSDNKPLPARPAAQLHTMDVLLAKSGVGLGHTVALAPARQTGTLALRSSADVNVADNRSDTQTPRTGESFNVVRYGVPGLTTQK